MSIGRHYSASKRSRDIYHSGRVGGGDLKAGMPNTTDMTITESYRVLYRIKKRKPRRVYNFVPFPYPRRNQSHGVGMLLKLFRYFARRQGVSPPVIRRPVWNGRAVNVGETINSYTGITYNKAPFLDRPLYGNNLGTIEKAPQYTYFANGMVSQ